MLGQRIGYKRVSTVDQQTARQLQDIELDRLFEDHASGKDTHRPALNELLRYAREGDTVIVQSIDRLARNLDDLRRLVLDLNARHIRVEFVSEQLIFAGDDDPLSTLLLSMVGAFAEFERALLKERQREGIALARTHNRYRGGTPKLSAAQAAALRRAAAEGTPKTALAREYGICRDSVYRYLRG